MLNDLKTLHIINYIMSEMHSYNLRDRSKIQSPQTLTSDIKNEVKKHLYDLRQQKRVDYKPQLNFDTDDDDSSYSNTFYKKY